MRWILLYVLIRTAQTEDREEWLRLRKALWTDAPTDQLAEELEHHLAGTSPIVAFVAVRAEGGLGGFLEASVRPWAEGCTTPNVGYLEGWYVDPDLRGKGLGRRLIEAAEEWARGKGCREMGSDAYEWNEAGRSAHRSLGYEERCTNVHFCKRL